MRFILFIHLFFSMFWACEGDCASCHSNLDYKNDKRHKSMQECKTCHTSEKMAQIDMGGCGQDCFACHNTQKLLNPKLSKHHQVIQECINCHTNLSPFDSKNLFKPKPLHNSPLQNILSTPLSKE